MNGEKEAPKGMEQGESKGGEQKWPAPLVLLPVPQVMKSLQHYQPLDVKGGRRRRPKPVSPRGPIFPSNLMPVSTAGRTAPRPHPGWAGITLTPVSFLLTLALSLTISTALPPLL